MSTAYDQYICLCGSLSNRLQLVGRHRWSLSHTRTVGPVVSYLRVLRRFVSVIEPRTFRMVNQRFLSTVELFQSLVLLEEFSPSLAAYGTSATSLLFIFVQLKEKEKNAIKEKFVVRFACYVPFYSDNALKQR
jgi:hypothetical protein